MEDNEKTEPVPEHDEIETKMMKVQLYWDLLNTQFVEGDDPVSLQVEDEITGFIKSQVQLLMGGAPAKRGRKPKHVALIPTLPTPLTRKRLAVKSRTARPEVKLHVAQATHKELPENGQAVPMTDSSMPMGSTFTGEEIEQEIITPEGFKRVKVYKKVVDNETGKEYYLGNDRTGDSLTGDGNKYLLVIGPSGNQIFRVISQQTLVNSKTIRATTNAEISAQSRIHAEQSLQAVQNHPLLSGALNAALKG